MFQNIVNAFKNKEIRTKILITIALLFVYRLGCWLPVPGISPGSLVAENDTLLGLLSQIAYENYKRNSVTYAELGDTIAYPHGKHRTGYEHKRNEYRNPNFIIRITEYTIAYTAALIPAYGNTCSLRNRKYKRSDFGKS